MTKPRKPETLLVSRGRPEQAGSPLNAPMQPASNFLIGAGREYSRDGSNPGWEALEDIVGSLEQGTATAFSSGMGAVAAVFDPLPANSTVAIPDDCYQGVAALANAGAESGRWQLKRLNLRDTEGWIAAMHECALLWLESPSNPLLAVTDVRAICDAPRPEGCRIAVDNTFATPLNQRPLLLGADYSVHSVTKFLGGHSDLLAGMVITKDDRLTQGLRSSRALNGATPGTLEAYLATRGLRTLALRLRQAEQNAQALAEFLQTHPRVEAVRYPGLSSHPDHVLASEQLNGFGSIISFDVAGGAAAADRVCQELRLIRHATSLGSVESTMERRAAVHGQEHLPPGLLRISVGIENAEDLKADLEQAFGSLTDMLGS